MCHVIIKTKQQFWVSSYKKQFWVSSYIYFEFLAFKEQLCHSSIFLWHRKRQPGDTGLNTWESAFAHIACGEPKLLEKPASVRQIRLINSPLLGRRECREGANGCFIALGSIFLKAEKSNRGECACSVTSLLEPHKPPTGSSLAPCHPNPRDHLATGSVIPPQLTDVH